MKNTELSREAKHFLKLYKLVILGYGISGQMPKQVNLNSIFNLLIKHHYSYEDDYFPDYYPDLADQVCFHYSNHYVSPLNVLIDGYSSLEFLKVWENGQEIKVR